VADNFRIKIKGLDRAIRKLKTLGIDINTEIGPTLFQEAEDIAGNSKEHFVPVDTGALRNSIFATRPKVSRNNVSVSIVAGGPAAPYALRVHEWLGAGVKWSVGGTGPKYLSQPLNQARPGIKRALQKALGKAIKKQR